LEEDLDKVYGLAKSLGVPEFELNGVKFLVIPSNISIKAGDSLDIIILFNNTINISASVFVKLSLPENTEEYLSSKPKEDVFWFFTIGGEQYDGMVFNIKSTIKTPKKKYSFMITIGKTKEEVKELRKEDIKDLIKDYKTLNLNIDVV